MAKCPFLKGKCIPNGCALGVEVVVDGKKKKICTFTILAHNVMVLAKRIDEHED